MNLTPTPADSGPADAVTPPDEDAEAGRTRAALQPDSDPSGAAASVSTRGASDSTPQKRGRVRRTLAYLNRDDRPLLRDGLLAVVALTAALGLAVQQQRLDDVRASRQEVLENTRFVRAVALDPNARSQPFADLNLQDAPLANLDLSCRNLTDDADILARGCANLSYANLSYANLGFANLRGAALRDADLTGAYLFGANLIDVGLYNADLTGANLNFADLTGADLSDANLSEAFLLNADLTDANLTGADLTGADLSGADLSGADLTRADLTGACHGQYMSDRVSRWPEGFTPTVRVQLLAGALMWHLPTLLAVKGVLARVDLTRPGCPTP